MNTAATNDRRALCPLCRETHIVTAADSVDDRGNVVDADEAVMTAHYRAEVSARSAAPFQLFTPRRTTRRPTLARRTEPAR